MRWQLGIGLKKRETLVLPNEEMAPQGFSGQYSWELYKSI